MDASDKSPNEAKEEKLIINSKYYITGKIG